MFRKEKCHQSPPTREYIGLKKHGPSLENWPDERLLLWCLEKPRLLSLSTIQSMIVLGGRNLGLTFICVFSLITSSQQIYAEILEIRTSTMQVLYPIFLKFYILSYFKTQTNLLNNRYKLISKRLNCTSN